MLSLAALGEGLSAVEQAPHDAAAPPQRLVLVSNKLPLVLSRDSSPAAETVPPDPTEIVQPQPVRLKGSRWSYVLSIDNLTSVFVSDFSMPVRWVGWPSRNVPEDEQDEVAALLALGGFYPVFLDEELLLRFYHGFCKEVLWPTFHYVSLPPAITQSLPGLWQAYYSANRRFSDRVLDVCGDGDLIWVQDYHLLMVPSMVRRHIHEVKLSLFLHCPFPSSETYRVLPMREELLRSMLNADLLGFHMFDYSRHFLSSCTRILGLEGTPKGIEVYGRFVSIGIFPMGIDMRRFGQAQAKPSVQERVAALRKRFGNRKIILGVDELDVSKGIVQKFQAFNYFLSNYPRWRNEVVLYQVSLRLASMDIPNSSEHNVELTEMAQRVNAEFGSGDFQPLVHDARKSIDTEELTALYRASHVCLATAARDGLNVVPFEFVACQPTSGVLILSEFMGCTRSLSGAMLVNPWDLEQVASALHDALSMDPAEQHERAAGLFDFVSRHTSSTFVSNVVADVIRSSENNSDLIYTGRGLGGQYRVSARETSLVQLDKAAVRSAMCASTRPLVIISSDVILTSLLGKPTVGFSPAGLTSPVSSQSSSVHLKHAMDTAAQEALLALCRRATVIIMSRHAAAPTLDWFLCAANHAYLCAENGGMYRPPGATEWIPQGSFASDVVLPLFQYYQERTPGSRTRICETALIWDFGSSHQDFGPWQAKELQLHLDEALANLPLEVISYDSSIEVRPAGVSRTAVLDTYLQQTISAPHDFVLCLGTDLRDDQDLFGSLRRHHDEPTSGELNATPPLPSWIAGQGAGVLADSLAGPVFTCEVVRQTARAEPTRAQYTLGSNQDALEVIAGLAADDGQSQAREC